jgi:hypothetical protein
MRGILFSILLAFSLSLPSLAKSRTPIREFLAGKPENKGMGVENPNLVSLMAEFYETLHTIEQRIAASKRDIEVARKQRWPRAQGLWQVRLDRAQIQYRLAWEMVGLFVDLTVGNTKLGTGLQASGFGLRPLKALHPEWFTPTTDAAESERRDKLIKSYVLERAGALYVSALKFLSLKHEPIVLAESKVVEAERRGVDLEAADVEAAVLPYVWLDDRNVALKEKNAIDHFIDGKLSDPNLKIRFFANEDILPKAQEIVTGFKALLNKPIPIKFDFDKPTAKQKEEFAHYVLGEGAIFNDKKVQAQAAALLHLYLRVLGILVDPFNVNTHDSNEIGRTAITVMFRHVLDIEGNEKLTLAQARDFDPLRGTKVSEEKFLPIKSTLDRLQTKLW